MKILYVEDNQHLRNVVGDLLSKKGVDVVTAEDGKAGWAYFKQSDFDVVVMDCVMPRMNGLELLKRIRAEYDTPVLMLTAKAKVSEKLEVFEAGVDDYLVKPFDIEELYARVIAISRRVSHSISNVIEWDGLKLDGDKRLIYLHGEVIPFSTKEFQMVKLFMSRKDQILTKDDIYGVIFKEEDASSSNLLEVYIYKLRKKLGKSVIQTKRGLGYLLVPPKRMES